MADTLSLVRSTRRAHRGFIVWDNPLRDPPASDDCMPRSSPQFFASAAQFRQWLRRNARTATELQVGYWKVDTGRPSMTWPESVDEALCFGWIDGVRRRIDEHAYQIRFTPRRMHSIWSAVNIAKVEALIAQGRMQPAGLAAYSHRADHKSAVYSYEQRENAALEASERARFKANPAAWSFFERCPPRQATRRLDRGLRRGKAPAEVSLIGASEGCDGAPAVAKPKP